MNNPHYYPVKFLGHLLSRIDINDTEPKDDLKKKMTSSQNINQISHFLKHFIQTKKRAKRKIGVIKSYDSKREEPKLIIACCPLISSRKFST